jgi:hypothetical protein
MRADLNLRQAYVDFLGVTVWKVSQPSTLTPLTTTLKSRQLNFIRFKSQCRFGDGSGGCALMSI